jgi:hypothetical protein
MQSRSARAFVLTLFLLSSGIVRSDVPVPNNVLDPKSPAEAWNVIHLSTGNVSKLLDENRLAEIPNQISLCSPSLRLLARTTETPEAIARIEELTKRAFISVNAIARGAQQDNAVGVKSALDSLRSILDSIAAYFDPKIAKADIFFCPMDPDLISERQGASCPKCGRALISRRIPYSYIYMKPGPSTVEMTAATSKPIEAGKTVDVKLRMAKPDKSPLLPADLVETHGQPIHLLIEEPSLGDYQYVIPAPTKTPGEYAFSFTPKKAAPYRIRANIVPAATGVQEMPFIDLPASGKPGPIENTENRFTATAEGCQFAINLSGGNHLPIKAQQTRKMSLEVTTADGKPVTSLQPVMTAFAHLAGFYGDLDTVIHLHPTGGDILNPDLRGGPLLGFFFHPPKPGFIRLYCQVKIDGKIILVPFSLNVQP